MPNHVKNVLTFEGSQLAIDELFKAIEGTDDDGKHMAIDFNKIIPMPESLKVEDGGMYDFAIKVFCANDDERAVIQREEKLTDKQIERYIRLGEIYAKNKLQYGYYTWYDWRYKNWGTKWNAYEIEQADNFIIFETAWYTPIPIITKISEMFPTVKVDHKFADEDIGNNCGHYIWQSGDIIYRNNMDDVDDETVERFALDLWGWEKEEDEEKE